jgi:1-aminocyclopropane-1-carboxylate deaminase/D-cysteine desulfhydrase-like pyridoxal-dependent ACC family enzyme
MDFKIETYPVKDSGVRYVIRDDYLYAGTKQRAVKQFIEQTMSPCTKTLLYTSSYNGYGPVATALAAGDLGLKCIVILCLKAFGKQTNSTKEEADKSSTVKKCRELRATVAYVDSWQKLNNQGMELQRDKTIYWIPLGFKDSKNLFEDILFEQLSPLAEIHKPIKRLWVVGGSGVLARALSRALPDANILLVPVVLEGKSFEKLYNYVMEYDNISILSSIPSVKITPYPTIEGYDSKAWDSACSCGINEDYVWNVAG